MKQPFENTLKFGFVVLCCAVAASFVVASPPSLIFWGYAALFALLLATLRMGYLAQQSASWLTLAYGSWITAHLLMFVKILCANPGEYQNLWVWTTLAVIALCGFKGGSAAILGRWSGVLGWWFCSILVFIPYLCWAV